MTITPQTNVTLEEIAQVIRGNDDFVICGHVGPDGDCLGSQLCLQHALTALGKRSTCVYVRKEPISRALGFLPGLQDFVAAESYDGPCGVFVGLDVPSRDRIGAAVDVLDRSETSITIDHHACDTTMCQHVYVDPNSASASIIVWELVKLLMDKPPLDSALCAYTGLVTDTGGFRYQNSTANAFRAASDLVEYGVNPAYVAAQVYQNRSIPSMQLEGLIIQRMRFLGDGNAVISWVSKADLDEFNAVKADVEPLIDVLRSLSDIRVACVLREQDDVVKGSLRSKDDTDVATLARELGGGGHKAAAGITLEMSLDDAIELVSSKISQLVSE